LRADIWKNENLQYGSCKNTQHTKLFAIGEIQFEKNRHWQQKDEGIKHHG
jgi:hypothetical protein